MIRKLRGWLVTVVVLAVTVRVAWWAIEPVITALVPYALGLLLLVLIIGTLYYRTRRW
jgi:hypothetical protein